VPQVQAEVEKTSVCGVRGKEHKKHKRRKKVHSFLRLLCFLCSFPSLLNAGEFLQQSPVFQSLLIGGDQRG
jgi:hypothetical protein